MLDARNEHLHLIHREGQMCHKESRPELFFEEENSG
jgi:hypothetical protein